jgi:hypothetical protein
MINIVLYIIVNRKTFFKHMNLNDPIKISVLNNLELTFFIHKTLVF